MGLIITIHAIVCILLIVIILIQAGRGGGLVESFSGVESMFGTKTNTFLTRTTTTLSILFFLTCVSLAFLSARQGRSLMSDIKTQDSTQKSLPAQPAQTQTPQEIPKQEVSQQETSKQELPKPEEPKSEAPKN